MYTTFTFYHYTQSQIPPRSPTRGRGGRTCGGLISECRFVYLIYIRC